MKYIHRDAAIENIKTLFRNTDSDMLSIEEAAKAWGREDIPKEKNKIWMGIRLTHLKYHNLVQPIYSRRNSRRVLDKIQLTLEGKKALGLVDSGGQNPDEIRPLDSNIKSPSDVMKIVSQFQKTHSEYQITFDIRLKEEDQ